MPGTEFGMPTAAPLPSAPASDTRSSEPTGVEKLPNAPREETRKTDSESRRPSQGPLLDQLLKEQDEDREGAFDGLQPPSASDLPAPESDRQGKTNSDDAIWW
jgi:hypothetical protein